MKTVCVVGNGPTAAGHGAEIDACDFVVRIKAFWRCAAEDAGERIDAWATYGADFPLPKGASETSELWYTQCPRQIIAQVGPDGFVKRVTRCVNAADQRCIAWFSDGQWDMVNRHTKNHPSTGMAAVSMVMRRFAFRRLCLFGFDSTTPDKPNFLDARPAKKKEPDHHHVLREKQEFAAIAKGTWLGKPTKVELHWPQMPEGIV